MHLVPPVQEVPTCRPRRNGLLRMLFVALPQQPSDLPQDRCSSPERRRRCLWALDRNRGRFKRQQRFLRDRDAYASLRLEFLQDYRGGIFGKSFDCFSLGARKRDNFFCDLCVINSFLQRITFCSGLKRMKKFDRDEHFLRGSSFIIRNTDMGPDRDILEQDGVHE